MSTTVMDLFLKQRKKEKEDQGGMRNHRWHQPSRALRSRLKWFDWCELNVDDSLESIEDNYTFDGFDTLEELCEWLWREEVSEDMPDWDEYDSWYEDFYNGSYDSYYERDRHWDGDDWYDDEYWTHKERVWGREYWEAGRADPEQFASKEEEIAYCYRIHHEDAAYDELCRWYSDDTEQEIDDHEWYSFDYRLATPEDNPSLHEHVLRKRAA